MLVRTKIFLDKRTFFKEYFYSIFLRMAIQEKRRIV